MQINYTTDALGALAKLVNYIESKNTLGSGLRWLKKFESFIEKKLRDPKQTRLCNNLTFNKLQLHCIVYNEWLIAFSIHNDFVLIEALLHKSRIKD